MQTFIHHYLAKSVRLATMTGLLAMATYQNHAQTVIADWSVTGINSFGPSPWYPTGIVPHLTYTGLTRGADVTTAGTAVSSAWGGDGWTGAAGCDITFTITADPGYTLSIDSIDLSFRRDNTGPAFGFLEYSINGGPYTLAYGLGFISVLPTGGGLPTLDLTDPMYNDLKNIPPGSILTFRITPDPVLGGGSNGPLFLFNSPMGYHGCKGLRVFGQVQPTCGTSTPIFTGLTDDGVTVSWDPIPGATGYEYAVYSTLDPPTVWTPTTDTSVTLSGLDPATQYYFYIRSLCTGETSLYTGGGFLTQNASTGILSQNATGNLFDVYPNPLENDLVIELANAPQGQAQLVLTDMTGKVLQSVTVTGHKTVMSTSALSPGAYMVRYTDERAHYSSLVVKQ